MKGIKKQKHKQSKYFTLMLVPYSSQKTKSIRIPHNLLYFLPSIIILVFCFSYIQVGRFKSIADSNQKDLEKTLEQNWDLKQKNSISNEDILKQKDYYEKQKADYQNIIDTYEEELKVYENKADELEQKIEELDKTKTELYKILSERIGYDPGISFATFNKNNEIPNNSGYTFLSAYSNVGLSINNNISKELDSAYTSLEKKLENEIKDFDSLASVVLKNKPFLDSIPNMWPIKTKIQITSYFGGRSNPFSGVGSESHLAIDLKASTGTKVYSTGGGEVSFAGYMNGYGYLVIIDHGYGIETYYAHNSSLKISKGSKVNRGDLIAESGSTGRSTGPHVHYEVRIDGVPKNPLDYIK